MCVLMLNTTLERKLISRGHRSCSQDSTYRAVRALTRISETPSRTVFHVREPSRSVLGKGRSQTCPYKTGVVGANTGFALKHARNHVRRERPARNHVRRERPAQPLEIQSEVLAS
jgi:hypothetical protein